MPEPKCDRCGCAIETVITGGLCDTCQMNTALLSIAESLKSIAATLGLWFEAATRFEGGEG